MHQCTCEGIWNNPAKVRKKKKYEVMWTTNLILYILYTYYIILSIVNHIFFPKPIGLHVIGVWYYSWLFCFRFEYTCTFYKLSYPEIGFKIHTESIVYEKPDRSYFCIFSIIEIWLGQPQIAIKTKKILFIFIIIYKEKFP